MSYSSYLCFVLIYCKKFKKFRFAFYFISGKFSQLKDILPFKWQSLLYVEFWAIFVLLERLIVKCFCFHFVSHGQNRQGMVVLILSKNLNLLKKNLRIENNAVLACRKLWWVNRQPWLGVSKTWFMDCANFVAALWLKGQRLKYWCNHWEKERRHYSGLLMVCSHVSHGSPPLPI
jgi:hypothetical protein